MPYFKHLTIIEKICFIISITIFFLLIILTVISLFVILKTGKLPSFVDILVLSIPVFVALFIFLPIAFKIRLRGEKRILERDVNHLSVTNDKKKEAKKDIEKIEASVDKLLSYRPILIKKLVNLFILLVIAALLPLLIIFLLSI